MRILLDTHMALWTITDDVRLPRPVRDILGGSNTDCYFSMGSLWEIAIKASLKKLDFTPSLVEKELQASGLQKLTIELAHLERVRTLPHIHRDPFDRLLIAQAETEPLKLVTVDRQLEAYGSAVWVL